MKEVLKRPFCSQTQVRSPIITQHNTTQHSILCIFWSLSHSILPNCFKIWITGLYAKLLPNTLTYVAWVRKPWEIGKSSDILETNVPPVRTTFLMQLSRQVCAGRWMFVTGTCLRNASCTGWVNRLCRSLCPVNLSTWPQLAVQVWDMGKAAFSWLEWVSNVRQGSPQKWQS